MLCCGLKALTVALAPRSPGGSFSLEGWGEIGWESAGIATERSDGGNDCSLPYLLPINLLDGGGSADIMEHHRPSKVSIRSDSGGC